MPEKKALIKRLNEVFDSDDVSTERIREAVGDANPIDVAEIMNRYDNDEKWAIFHALDDEARAVVIDETDETTREQLLENSRPAQISELINAMPPDEATDLLESLPEEQRAEVLAKVDDEQARDVIELNRYPPESAGGIMTTRFHSARPGEKAGHVLEKVQRETDVEAPNFVFVMDPKDVLVGVAKVSELLSCDETVPIIDVADREPIAANVADDQEEVSKLAVRYNLQVVPIVDDQNRMLGIVTHDDLVDVIEHEAAEDLYKLAGEAFQPLSEPVLRRVMKRLPWLAITLGGGMLLSFILKQMNFSGPLVFLPVIMGMSGNVGIQSSATMVRGLATGEVGDMSRLLVFERELLVGLTIGFICGALTACAAHVLQGAAFPGIGFATGVGMMTGITVAACLGTLVPMICHVVSVDPAIAAGPFITTMNDVLCSVLYVKIVHVFVAATNQVGA